MFHVSVAKNIDSESAARALVDDADKTGREAVAVLLVGGKHQPEPFIEAVRQRFPQVEIVGGAVAGIIHPDLVGYSGYEAGLLMIDGSDAGAPRVFVASDLDKGEGGTGRVLGEKVRGEVPAGSTMWILYDSVANPDPLTLHPASPLMSGFYEGLGDHSLRVIGAGMLTDMFLTDSFMIHDGGVHRHSAVALAFPPSAKSETGIAHGCRPISSYMRITSVEGAEVFELDDKPALDVLESTLGPTVSDPATNISIIATLGHRSHGSQFDAYDENDYANRLILRVDRDRRSLTLFEPDFQNGAEVQIMVRDNALMVSSLSKCTEQVFSKINGSKPELALYIDCAGRASAMTGSEKEEAQAFLEALPPGVPALGFYSGVEIAPMGKRSRSLDWTGVLTVLHN